MNDDSDTAFCRAASEAPPRGRRSIQRAALRILVTTRRTWRELSLDSPPCRGYCAGQSSSEAGETVILPDTAGRQRAAA